jgi:hypothetical protein
MRFRRYRLRIHAVRHMLEEGFEEQHIVQALTDRKRKILEDYPEQQSCLILGTCAIGPRTRAHLHVVCDLSSEESVDIVTAYLPQSPWWVTPSRRGQRR